MSACELCHWDPARTVGAEWVFQGSLAVKWHGGKLVPAPWSTNQLGGNSKRHFLYRRYRDALADYLAPWLNRVPHAQRFRAGIITRHWGKGARAFDQENLIGGCKPLIDVLRQYGAIIDDSPSYWRGYYQQQKSTTTEASFSIRLLEFEY